MARGRADSELPIAEHPDETGVHGLGRLNAGEDAIARAWRGEAGVAASDLRDVLPLPRADASVLPEDISAVEAGLLLDCVNMCVAGPNCLGGGLCCKGFGPCRAGGPSSAQRAAVTHIAKQTVAIFGRLARAPVGTSPQEALEGFEPRSAEPPPRLVAANMDLPCIEARPGALRRARPAVLPHGT